MEAERNEEVEPTEAESEQIIATGNHHGYYVRKATDIPRLNELLGGDNDNVLAAVFGVAVAIEKRLDIVSGLVAYFREYFEEELKLGIPFDREFSDNDSFVMPWIYFVRDVTETAELLRQPRQPDTETVVA